MIPVSHTSGEERSLFSWLIGVVDYNYLVPRYCVDRALEPYGVCLTGSEAQLEVRLITEQTSSMSLSQPPPPPPEQQQSTVPELEPRAHERVGHQDIEYIDPLLLHGDDAIARPSQWTIPRAPDSGYVSNEHQRQSNQPPEFTTRYVGTDAEDRDDPRTTSTLAAGTTLTKEDVGSGSILDETITGIGIEPLPGSHDFDDDDIMHYPRNVIYP